MKFVFINALLQNTDKYIVRYIYPYISYHYIFKYNNIYNEYIVE